MTEGRAIITSDLDFGELIFHRKLAATEIVLLRFKGMSLAERLATFTQRWPLVEPKAVGNFVVISASRIRIRPLA
jgi:hypothetical protein